MWRSKFEADSKEDVLKERLTIVAAGRKWPRASIGKYGSSITGSHTQRHSDLAPTISLRSLPTRSTYAVGPTYASFERTCCQHAACAHHARPRPLALHTARRPPPPLISPFLPPLPSSPQPASSALCTSLTLNLERASIFTAATLVTIDDAATLVGVAPQPGKEKRQHALLELLTSECKYASELALIRGI
jgi:hypothetical protein